MVDVVINEPYFGKVSKVEEFYTEKDGVEVRYVATTALDSSTITKDIYYRETPHPEFGNRYFSISFISGKVWIGNADIIEDLEFGMIENDEGEWVYSTHRHDYVTTEHGVIDGGRAYVRGYNITMFKMVDGKFIKQEKSHESHS